jgi:hypothetical protein
MSMGSMGIRLDDIIWAVPGSFDKKGEEGVIFYQAKGGILFRLFCLTNSARMFLAPCSYLKIVQYS